MIKTAAFVALPCGGGAPGVVCPLCCLCVTMPPPAKKQRQCSAKAPDLMLVNMQKKYQELSATQPSIVLAQIQDILQGRPEMAQQVLWLITSGALNPAMGETTDDVLPTSVNKWRLLSQRTLKELVAGLEPEREEVFSKIHRGHLLEMLTFALHVDPGSAVYYKKKEHHAQCVSGFLFPVGVLGLHSRGVSSTVKHEVCKFRICSCLLDIEHHLSKGQATIP